jgi:ribosomal protein S27E
MGLGCPKCSRTPVIYSTTTKWWTCKTCKHMWLDAMTPAAKAGIAPKAVARVATKTPSARKHAPKKAAAKPVKKSPAKKK